MELQIQNQELAPIEANLTQIKDYVSGVVAKYQGATYTDEQMKLAKADLADLRHLKDDIETKRKQVKAKWNAPYLAFETQIKAITALIDEPVALIDGQIKDYESRRKEARKADLEAKFEKFNTLGPLVQFEQVLEPQWLNASVSDSKATSNLFDKMERITKDIAQLESVVSSDNRTVCIKHYLDTLNLADAILQDTLLKAEKKKQAAVLGEVDPVQQQPKPQVQAAIDEEDIFADMPPAPSDYPETRRFVITGTPAQINELRRAAVQIGIKMREVF